MSTARKNILPEFESYDFASIVLKCYPKIKVLPMLLKTKKKEVKITKNSNFETKTRFFEFQIAINWLKLAQIGRIAHQKFRLASYSYQKNNFVLRPKIEEDVLKILPPQRPFLGGGGKIIKCCF
jgi:hypothetical protein